MTRVDIVVTTHNSPDLLAACLCHLRESSFRDYRLIVVDDASNEPALAVVTREHPGATVLRVASNCGLVRGLNAGIRAGRSEYVALLNDDTEVTQSWLGVLVEAADSQPQAASVASKIRLMSDRWKFHAAGDTFSVRGVAENRGVWLDDLGQYDQMEEVFGACAGAALYRRSALEAIKLPNRDYFDRRLYMYLEDVDLAWRLQLAGFASIYAPDALVYHHLSATGGGNLASYFVNRNRLLVLSRTVPRAVLRTYRRRIVATQVGIVASHLRHAREPAARSALRGIAAGLALSLAKRTRPDAPDTTQLSRIELLLVE